MLFNFLEWLASHGGRLNQAGDRCADIFYESDEFIDQKWTEYLKELKIK